MEDVQDNLTDQKEDGVDSDNGAASNMTTAEEEEAESRVRLEHFEKLDEEMKATLQELNVRGDDVQEVHAEFDKLYRSFLNVHNSELRYERRTRELRGEIATVRSKTHTIKQEDARLMERSVQLKEVIERTWSSVSQANAKEKANKSLISRIKADIEGLEMKLSMDQGGPSRKNWKLISCVLNDRIRWQSWTRSSL